MKTLIALSVVSVLLLGCVSFPMPTEEDLTRTFPQQAREVFHAVRAALAEVGCESIEGDLKSGYLSAQREEFLGIGNCMFYRVKFLEDPQALSTVVSVDIYLRDCKAIVALRARAYKQDFDEFWAAVQANLLAK